MLQPSHEQIDLVAEAIREAVSDVNEGEPLTAKHWEWIALKVLQVLDDEGYLV